MDLRIRTLGPLRLSLGERELPELLAQRLRSALLIFLAHEGATRRDSLLPMFWPDRDPARARHALRQMLYELRQIVGDALVVGRSDVSLHASSDAAAFQAAADAGARNEALDLYGGAFLVGFALDIPAFDGWADRRRAHYARLHRRLRREALDACHTSGDVQQALRVARQWIEVDPLEDEAAHEYLRALVLAGQRNAALQFYDAYEKRLGTELQVEPLDETRALIAEIRSGTAAVSLPIRTPSLRPGPALPDHGQPDNRVDAPVQAPPGASSEPRLPRRRTGRMQLAAAALAALVLVGTAFSVRESLRRGVGAPAKPTVRIVVLPFNDHADNAQGLADALTQSVAYSLARSRTLDVVSPNGVAFLRERGMADDSLRRHLAADYLVAGNVSNDDGWVRVSMELLDGRSGSIVRSERIERPVSQSRSLDDDVVQRAVRFLRREVGSHVAVQLTRAQTSSEEAWRRVIEAGALQAQMARLIRENDYAAVERDLLRADSLLMDAARLDRRWAEPLVRRGWLYERRAFVLRASAPADSAARRKLLEAALDFSGRAAERETKNADAYELRGALLHELSALPGITSDSAAARRDSAERALRQSVLLDPHAATAWRRLAELLFRSARYAEAKNAAERAHQLDPWSPDANSIVNLLFATSLEIGEDDEAERWCSEGRRSFPNELPFLYCILALHAWSDGVAADPSAVRMEMERFQAAHMRLQPPLLLRFEAMLAAAYARAGQSDSAQAVLKRLEGLDDPGVLWMSAAAWAALRQDTRAAAIIERVRAADTAMAERVFAQRPFARLHQRTRLP